jgi:hypothetical protein
MVVQLNMIQSSKKKSGNLDITKPGTVPKPCLVSKNFQDSPSHQMSRHIHGALNIDKKN